MSGAYYTEIVYGMPFSYQCQCTDFNHIKKEVFINYLVGNRTIKKWVPYDQVTFYPYN